MTKLQLETAVRADINKLCDTPTPMSEIIVQNLRHGATTAINRIVLELAREGYKFEKLPNWKPL